MKIKLMLAAALLSGLAANLAVAKDIEKGETLYISCRDLPLHASPSGFSTVMDILDYGSAVVITETVYESLDPEKKDKTLVWAKIQTDRDAVGYVGGGCLISERLLKRQNQGKTSEKYKSTSASVAGKGFSESEEDIDHLAMKGWGGDAKGGNNFDYETLNAILKTPAETNPSDAYRGFRMEGGLAEFTGKPRRPGKQLPEEAEYVAQNNKEAQATHGGESGTINQRKTTRVYPKAETPTHAVASEEPPPRIISSQGRRDRVQQAASRDHDQVQKPRRDIHISRRTDNHSRPIDERLSLKELYHWIKVYRNKNPMRSIELCNRAIQINPRFAQIYNERGYANVYLGNYERACVDFVSAEKLGDDFGIKWSMAKGFCR
jgi:tetratricopeptide (TPR) repeat protein